MDKLINYGIVNSLPNAKCWREVSTPHYNHPMRILLLSLQHLQLDNPSYHELFSTEIDSDNEKSIKDYMNFGKKEYQKKVDINMYITQGTEKSEIIASAFDLI